MTRHARTWLGLLLYMHARTDGRPVVLIRNVHACEAGRQRERDTYSHTHTRTHPLILIGGGELGMDEVIY
jgi:hypothetical protein